MAKCIKLRSKIVQIKKQFFRENIDFKLTKNYNGNQRKLVTNHGNGAANNK